MFLDGSAQDISEFGDLGISDLLPALEKDALCEPQRKGQKQPFGQSTIPPESCNSFEPSRPGATVAPSNTDGYLSPETNTDGDTYPEANAQPDFDFNVDGSADTDTDPNLNHHAHSDAEADTGTVEDASTRTGTGIGAHLDIDTNTDVEAIKSLNIGASIAAVANQDARDVNTFPTPPSVSPNAKPSLGPGLSRIVIELPTSSLVNPSSCFQDLRESHDPDTDTRPPLRPEADAVRHLLQSSSQAGDIEFHLTNFSVYKTVPKGKGYHTHDMQYELRSLHRLFSQGMSTMYLDGTLTHEGRSYRVERVPFSEVSVGNYELEHHTIKSNIWIRSVLHSRHDRPIYYKAGKPATEYVRYHSAFRWIANLGKHVVDFLEVCHGSNVHEKTTTSRKLVRIQDFQTDFSAFILQHHGSSQAFRTWYHQHGSSDFRVAVHACLAYLHKEAVGVLGEAADRHPLWKQCLHFTDIPVQPSRSHALEGGMTPTICTAYTKRLFDHLIWGDFLKPVRMCEDSRQRRKHLLAKFDFPRAHLRPAAATDAKGGRQSMIASIYEGTTVSTHPDPEAVGGWKQETSKNHHDLAWYGLVQQVHHVGDKNGKRKAKGRGKRVFDVIWMYKPVDTPCAKMKYPHAKELFISDDCTCKSGFGAKVHEDDVVGTHSVEWGGGTGTEAEFFVRLFYRHEDKRWVRFQESQMICNHERCKSLEVVDKYVVGDTVLVELGGVNRDKVPQLEVCEVLGFGFTAATKDCEKRCRNVQLKRLLRRSVVDGSKAGRGCPANELVYPYSDGNNVSVAPGKIRSGCLVRVYTPGAEIPAPYNRNGGSNAFFMSRAAVVIDKDTGTMIFPPLELSPPTLRQGFDPTKPMKKLRGLDLFCGGGNFGRGLEEGGAVENLWCNDIWAPAIHTYAANKPHGSVHPFLGSVDDLLHEAIEGRFRNNVPAPGEVDQISGGSPCQGFSLLTRDKTTPKQRKNQSLVASFVSYVDFYRPAFGILENVPNMVQTRDRDNDVFSQMVCAIVGLGYQCQMFRLDAWSFGAAQSRSRVILVFARPGMRLPERPRASHSHPGFVGKGRLGVIASGAAFEERDLGMSAAFPFTTVREAVGDLPEMDGKVEWCTPFPDHRLSLGLTQPIRHQMRAIPIQPYGINFAKAWYEGQGTFMAGQRDLFPKKGTSSRVGEKSKGWGRVDPRKLFATVATLCSPTDAYTGGGWMHWEQPRAVSVAEVKRAQGFGDGEVVLGAGRDQWKIVGNSVARQVALAVGLAVREAWVGSNCEGVDRVEEEEYSGYGLGSGYDDYDGDHDDGWDGEGDGGEIIYEEYEGDEDDDQEGDDVQAVAGSPTRMPDLVTRDSYDDDSDVWGRSGDGDGSEQSGGSDGGDIRYEGEDEAEAYNDDDDDFFKVVSDIPKRRLSVVLAEHQTPTAKRARLDAELQAAIGRSGGSSFMPMSPR